ncbi:MAG: FAD-dependent oxidoreductase [Candidatus Thermoplasmatota archaeon]
MRINNHPILDFERKKRITFYYNDKIITGYEGESIASALHAEGIHVLSHSLRYDRPRGFFCGIGKCSSCFMTVNGTPNIRTCITPISEGIRVKTQRGIGVLSDKPYKPYPKRNIECEIGIIGAGPAGMMAAISAAEQGARSILLVDENNRIGGQLIKQTHRFFGSKSEKAGTRGIRIATELLSMIKVRKEITILPQTTVFGYYPDEEYHRLVANTRMIDGDQLVDIRCKRVIVATGAMENMLAFPGNDLPGVYGAGGVQTLMNVYGVIPGKRVLMIGAGNVGLIVSYQLLQAGVEVDRVVEALPYIGGYHVHAAKLRRCGVPIYTSHTIIEAKGDTHVQGAVVSAVDRDCKPIKGTEETIECDTICLAVGLTPSIRLLEQAMAKTMYIPEAGGFVALHDSTMQTSRQGLYVAGDASGIEEASTAMIEGMLAGVSAAYTLNYDNNARVIQDKCRKTLEVFRSGPFGKNPRICKEKISCCLQEEG